MWRNTTARFGRGSLLLHWIIAVLFLAQIPIGFFMTGMPHDATREAVVSLHKSIGFAILFLSALRVLWVIVNRAPQAAAAKPASERMAATAVKWILLCVLIVIPLLGWAVTSAHGATRIFGWISIPPLPVPVSHAWHHTFETWHGDLAYAASAIACLHIAAALYHHFLRKDPTLRRMLGR